MSNEKKTLSNNILESLNNIRFSKGWSLDDLASYLEVNNLTLRNAMSRQVWSDMLVTILKLKKVIPEELCYEYKKEIEREKIKKRIKIKNSIKVE